MKQNKPQSESYTSKSDKDKKAKPVGKRYTNKLAKKLGKSPYATPTNKDVDKYLGNGIYDEKRKDKSDKKPSKKFDVGGGINYNWRALEGLNVYCTSFSKVFGNIYALRPESSGSGTGWIASGEEVRNEQDIKKQVNSLADLGFVADLPIYDGVWTYDPITNGAEIHFYRHTGYTKKGNLKFETYYFIVEYLQEDLIDDDGDVIENVFGIDWLEDACKVQNIKNGLVDNETNFQLYDYMNRFIEDKSEKIFANGGGIGEEKPLSYYRYETPKVTIAWTGKIQPMGRFYSAEEAMEAIKKQAQTESELKQYSIVTPDKVIHLGNEYAIRFSNGGGVGDLKYFIGKELKFGSPSYELKFIVTDIEKVKGGYGFTGDMPQATIGTEGHYFIIPSKDFNEFIETGEASWITRNGAYNSLINPYFKNGGGVGDMGEKILTYKLKDDYFQVKIKYNSKHRQWEGLHRAINPKTNEPIQKWGFDKDSLIADTKENLIQKYIDEYGEDFYSKGGSINSEISKSELEQMVGRKLNGWNDDVVYHNGKTYKKCFLKPYYKTI